MLDVDSRITKNAAVYEFFVFVILMDSSIARVGFEMLLLHIFCAETAVQNKIIVFSYDHISCSC